MRVCQNDILNGEGLAAILSLGPLGALISQGVFYLEVPDVRPRQPTRHTDCPG